MNLLDAACCFLLAVAAGTGVGGGGLYLLYMTGVMGISHMTAQAVNLLFFIAAALPATVTRARTLPWGQAVLCVLGGLPGVLLGTWLRGKLDEALLAKVFGGLLVAGGLSVFFLKERAD